MRLFILSVFHDAIVLYVLPAKFSSIPFYKAQLEKLFISKIQPSFESRERVRARYGIIVLINLARQNEQSTKDEKGLTKHDERLLYPRTLEKKVNVLEATLT